MIVTVEGDFYYRDNLTIFGTIYFLSMNLFYNLQGSYLHELYGQSFLLIEDE